MKSDTFRFIVVMLVGIFLVGAWWNWQHPDRPPGRQIVQAEEPAWMDWDLVLAIEQVESGGSPDAVGDGGLAVGVLQIHPIMVRDVNRILGREAYTLDDRRSRTRSYEMFWIYTQHYSADADRETIARRWQGGPRGDQKQATERYWQRVREALPREDGSRTGVFAPTR